MGFTKGEDSRRTRGVERELRREFSPEFLNRVDRVVTYQPLGDEGVKRVYELELARVHKHVMKKLEIGFELVVGEDVEERVLEDGVDPRYGARGVKREIFKYVLVPLAELRENEGVSAGDTIRVGLRGAEKVGYAVG